MAQWQDGAEYAPAERPDGFATPRTPPLSAAPQAPHPAEGLPLQAPDAFQPSPVPVPPLSALVPSTAPTRDPHQAFDSGMTIVEGSAWGSAHSASSTNHPSWDPTKPIVTSASFGSSTSSHGHGTGHAALGGTAAPGGTGAVGGAVGLDQLPPPGQGQFPQVPNGQNQASWAPNQFAPPTGAPVSAYSPAPLPWNPPGQPSTGQGRFMTVLKNMGYALAILLAAGMLIRPISFVVLLSAIPLSLMATVRKQTLMRTAAIAAATALVMGLLFPGDNDATSAIAGYAQFACLVVLVLDLIALWRWPREGQR